MCLLYEFFCDFVCATMRSYCLYTRMRVLFQHKCRQIEDRLIFSKFLTCLLFADKAHILLFFIKLL